MTCDSCEFLFINEQPSHEIGCPNSRKRWNPESATWVRYVQCRECGYEVQEGESCDCREYVE